MRNWDFVRLFKERGYNVSFFSPCKAEGNAYYEELLLVLFLRCFVCTLTCVCKHGVNAKRCRLNSKEFDRLFDEVSPVDVAVFDR